jgi:hypothetical protein
MPVISERNLYAGVNPHLNSYLQNPPSLWSTFHGSHITDLVRALDAVLPDGYGASAEESIQYVVAETYLQPLRVQPDVLLYQDQPSVSNTASSIADATTPYLIEAAAEVLPLEQPLSAVIVRDLANGARPVTRLELLSPANLPHGSYHERYLQKRAEALRGGLHLVEIDYLHQYQPVVPSARSYADGDADAFPYVITVTHVQLAPDDSRTYFYGSHVDDPLPRIVVPLLANAQIVFDLNPAYNQTATSTRRFRNASDYSQLPRAFERYSAADQARIRQRMAHIAQGQA